MAGKLESKKGKIKRLNITNHLFSFFSLSILPSISSSLAIAGADYCVIAADTRQSEGYSINSRYAPKAFKL